MLRTTSDHCMRAGDAQGASGRKAAALERRQHAAHRRAVGTARACAHLQPVAQDSKLGIFVNRYSEMDPGYIRSMATEWCHRRRRSPPPARAAKIASAARGLRCLSRAGRGWAGVGFCGVGAWLAQGSTAQQTWLGEGPGKPPALTRKQNSPGPKAIDPSGESSKWVAYDVIEGTRRAGGDAAEIDPGAS